MPPHQASVAEADAVTSAHTRDEMEAAAERARAELATKEHPLSDD
jgi:inorganic pyrophosphatase